jgi:hypothetical protein
VGITEFLKKTSTLLTATNSYTYDLTHANLSIYGTQTPKIKHISTLVLHGGTIKTGMAEIDLWNRVMA